jgi:hypothetical protein
MITENYWFVRFHSTRILRLSNAAGSQLDFQSPFIEKKMALLAKVQDEAGHGLYLYSATETLGDGSIRADRDATYEDMLQGKANIQVFSIIQR